MTDYKKISDDLHERFSEAFNKLHISELKDEIAAKDETIAALGHMIDEQQEEIERLKKQLPDGMQGCTIVFEECSVGHGSLRGTNWIKNECPHCKIETLETALAMATHDVNKYIDRLEKKESEVDYQVSWVKDLADDLIKAESKIAKLQADLEYADQHSARIEKFLWDLIEQYKALVERMKNAR